MLARRLKETFICRLFFLLAVSALFFPSTIVAAGTSYQRCKTATTCTVGEFLYDDSYMPITSATCTLTSRNPDGTLYHNAVAMTSAAQNDGWYSYSFDTTGKTDGVYRSQVCCTSGADYMCLDKTFEIGASFTSSTEIASTVWDASTGSYTTPGSFGANLQSAAPSTSDIWNYSGRSLTTYGSLIADMWSYSGRSLTSFGTLIADIWSNATRTLTAGILGDGTHLATVEDVQVATGSAVTSIKGASNKDLTQVGTQVAGVQTTADTINGKIDTLTTTVDAMSTNVSSILTKWGAYSASDIITAVNGISTNIGTNTDTCSNNTVFGNAYCAKSKWGAETASGLLLATNNVATTAAALRAELDYNGKSTTAYADLQTLLTNLGTVASNVSTVQTTTDTINTKADTILTTVTRIDTTTSTGSAAIAALSTKIDALDTKIDTLTSSVGTLVTKWGVYSASDLISAIGDIQTSIGTSSDACLSTTVFGYARCAKEKWGTRTADDLLTATNSVSTVASALRAELAYNGKSTTAYEDLQTLLSTLSTVSSNVGTVQTQVASVDTKVDTVSTQVLGVQSTANSIYSTTSTFSAQLTGVDTKITTLTNNVTALTTTVGGISTNVNSLLSNWSSYTMNDVITRLTSLQSSIGSSSNTCVDTTVFGYLTCIENNSGGGGGSDAAILAAAQSAAADAAALRTELEYNGKSTTAYADLQTLKTNVSSMQSLIGTTGDASSVSSLFGHIKQVQETIDNLDTSGAGLSDLLAKWGSYSATDIYDKVKDLSEKIDDVNTVSNVASILTLSQANSVDMLALKNKVLELRALTQVNKQLLQEGTAKPIVKLWLEEGSIIFKTLITNPSGTTQSVPVKFYLPKEAREKDILKVDKELTAKYDPDQDAVYVSGEFTLGPSQTKIVAIEVEDIWKISDKEIESVRLQSEELFKPLINTSYFAQGTTLKSDITASLDTINRLQSEAKTPEARIKAYRDALTEMKRAKEDLSSMKLIVSSASSAGSMLGFVGGVQTVAVWGLIIVLTAGFVFLALYMRLLTTQLKGHAAAAAPREAKEPVVHAPKKIRSLPKLRLPEFPPEYRMLATVGIAIIVALLVITVALKSNFFRQPQTAQPSPTPTSTPKPTVSPTSTPAAMSEEVMLKDSKQVLGASTEQIVPDYVTSEANVNVRTSPSPSVRIKMVLPKGALLKKIGQERDWINVWVVGTETKTSEPVDGWVRSDFIEKK